MQDMNKMSPAEKLEYRLSIVRDAQAWKKPDKMPINGNMFNWMFLDAGYSVTVKRVWSVDSETWHYYWNNCSDEIPLCFDTSASFVTQEMRKTRLRKCNIAQVDGINTRRMLYLWYFEKNAEKLKHFFSCVKVSFL